MAISIRKVVRPKTDDPRRLLQGLIKPHKAQGDPIQADPEGYIANTTIIAICLHHCLAPFPSRHRLQQAPQPLQHSGGSALRRRRRNS